MPRVGISASMPSELAEALRQSAARSDRSFSEEIRVAVRAHLGPEAPADEVLVQAKPGGQDS